MREHVVVPAIRSREVAWAQRSVVRHCEDALKVLDFSNAPFSVHPSQYPIEMQAKSIRSGILRDRDCTISTSIIRLASDHQ
jgi:hypothetical protein